MAHISYMTHFQNFKIVEVYSVFLWCKLIGIFAIFMVLEWMLQYKIVVSFLWDICVCVCVHVFLCVLTIQHIICEIINYNLKLV